MRLFRKDTGSKILSFVLILALIAPLLPQGVFAATPAENEYNELVGRMNGVKTSINGLLENYEEIDCGNDYIVNVQDELEVFVSNIEHDLGVAAALAAGAYNDSRLNEALASGSTNYNETNFHDAFQNKYEAATTYLKQGGIGKQKYKIVSLQYFFSYKSKLNPNYSASHGLVGMTENGKKNIVDFAENTINNIVQLPIMLNILNGYKEEAEDIEDYFLDLPCVYEDCEDFKEIDCVEWTHRIIVGEDEDREEGVNKYKADLAKFKENIKRDIKIVGILATGNISDHSNLPFANNNGNTYFNYTEAKTKLDKIKAAVSFLENGGYTCGSISLLRQWDNQLSYKSSFNSGDNGYKVSIPLTGDFKEENTNPVLPLAEATLSILHSGVTSDNLDMAYQIKVNEVNKYINDAEKLKDKTVPPDGTYSQGEFEQAIEDFILKSERDLAIADMLYTGDIVQSYSSIWVQTLGDLKKDYKGKSDSERQANALRYFNEGGYAYGYSLFGLGYQLEYKSNFHQDYSSGLFGILANKANVITIMGDTVAALKLGNKYMTKKELAVFKYEQSKNRLLAIKNDPSSLIDALLENDYELKQLIDDLNIILGSLDDIISIVDKLDSLGIGADIIDPILEGVGLNYETLRSLTSLRDLLNGIGIDTSGDFIIEESMTPVIGGLIGFAIDAAIGIGDTAVLIGTAEAYDLAAKGLDDAYNALMDNAAKAVSDLLKPITNIIEPIRPYLHMLSATISLLNNTITLVEQVTNLTTDFSIGGVSDATGTLANSLDDLARILESFEDAGTFELLNRILENVNLGGTISNGVAELLNQVINRVIGQNLDISGEDLGFLGDAVDYIVGEGLKNPAALAPVLRTSADILRRIAQLEQGMQHAIDGEFEEAWAALTNDFGSLFTSTIQLWRDIAGIFNTSTTEEFTAFAAGAGLEEPDIEGDDLFLNSFASLMSAEAADTFETLANPKKSFSEKTKRIGEFGSFLGDVREMINHLRTLRDDINTVWDWTDDNLTQEDATELMEELRGYYVSSIHGCVSSGFHKPVLKTIISKLIDAANEIKDFHCVVMIPKHPEKLKIKATPSEEEGVFYTFSTNYDKCINRTAKLLKALKIQLGYEVIKPSDGSFEMDGNELIAGDELKDGKHKVCVSYNIYFNGCCHKFFKKLAEKCVKVNVGDNETESFPYTVTYYVYGEYEEIGRFEGTVSELGTIVDEEEIEDNVPKGYKIDEINSPDLSFEVTEENNDFIVYCVIDEEPVLKHTVLFKDGDITLYTKKVEHENTVARPKDPKKEGCTFLGWYVDIELSEEFDFDTGITEDVILYAKWEINKYTVTFVDYDGTVLKKETVEHGKAATAPSKPSRSGYTFTGWDKGFTNVTSDLVVTAKYKSDGGGGSGGGSGGGGSNRTKEPEIVVVPEEEIPADLPKLNKEEHFQYIQGYPDGTVRPEGHITRDEVAAVFFRLLDAEYRESIRTTEHKFSDVAPERWSNTHIATLANGGIVTGYTDGTFKPNNYITRGEMATIASRFDKLSPFEKDSFSDIEGHWANKYINSAVKKGWINGYKDGTFKPDQYITRAEFVTLVNNVLERRVTRSEILPKAKQFPDLSEDKWYYEAMQEAINSHHYERLENGYETWTEIYYPELEM
ncbi:MAG: S-layer homology domain-containing protein [Firmicutes bacterium]|nr:S-layer homology domain-containing protein [Bacillota bacterium]